MLFIGGSQDGKHMDVGHKERLQFPASRPRTPVSINHTYEHLPISERIEFDYYDEMEFSVEGKSYHIYKLETLTPRAAFEMLLAGYKPSK